MNVCKVYTYRKIHILVPLDNFYKSVLSELIKGLLECGLEVTDVGVGPTPMLYFSVYHLGLDAGIMVTGSHNPKNHNGFKMMLKSRPFFGDDIKKIIPTVLKGKSAYGCSEHSNGCTYVVPFNTIKELAKGEKLTKELVYKILLSQ